MLNALSGGNPDYKRQTGVFWKKICHFKQGIGVRLLYGFDRVVDQSLLALFSMASLENEGAAWMKTGEKQEVPYQNRCLKVAAGSHKLLKKHGGRCGDRTCDLLLVSKAVLL